MQDLITPSTLNIVGVAFALLGTAILFLDLRGDKVSGKARETQIYIAKLDQTINELRAIPKDRGMVTEEGIDIGETFEMMEAGAEEAQVKNRQTHIDLLDEIDTQAKKHRAAVALAVALVLFGGLLQLVALSL
jgi:hypothetical protein